jgi:hypothetical protein
MKSRQHKTSGNCLQYWIKLNIPSFAKFSFVDVKIAYYNDNRSKSGAIKYKLLAITQLKTCFIKTEPEGSNF